MTITKKAFKKVLNEKYGEAKEEGWNRKSGPKTRLYGDWLYSADKGMFDMLYHQYIQTRL